MSNARRGWRWLSPFQRITTSGQYVPQIDGLRFLAIFLVIAFHVRGSYLASQCVSTSPEVTAHWFLRLSDTWNWGVPLFFVISGYVLGLPFCEQAREGSAWNLRKYYLRRLTRIEPPLVINLLLMFAALVLIKHTSASELLKNLLSSLTYSHNLIFNQMSAVNYVTWSLEIEAQFYLLAPLMALPFFLKRQRLRWSIWVLLILLFATSTHALSDKTSRLYYTLLCHGQFFLAGFFCADVFHTRREIKNFRRWDFACLFCLIIFQTCWSYLHTLSFWLSPFLLMGLLLSVLHGRLIARISGWPPIATIGGMCYTLYLYHPVIKSTLGKLTFPWTPFGSYPVDTALQICLHFAVITAVGSGLFLLFEKPFMNRNWTNDLLIFLGLTVKSKKEDQ